MSSRLPTEHQLWQWLKTSVWAFPVVLFLVMLVLTGLRIHGSSVGMYHQILNGETVDDPNLLWGNPRPIRSDEWLSMTPVIASQVQNDFPRFNEDLGSGRDVSLQPELPYRDWTMFFRPQNLSFFVMPLEFAFAFKWWFLMYILVVSCYFFTLRIMKGKKLFAILFSIAMVLSPFLLWWHQTGVYATIAYGFMVAILGMRLITKETIPFLKNKPQYWSDILHMTGIAYIITCFGLILYPPFQIPIAIVVLFFMIGYLLEKLINKKIGWKILLRRVGFIAGGVVIAGIIGGVFILTRQEVIHAISNTVYPGSRVVSSGDLKLIKVFDGFVMPQLQTSKGVHLPNNQSEASNFILLMPYLLVPAIALVVYQYKRTRKVDWVLVMITLCALMFLARVFIPFGDPFYKLLLLHKVPNIRLMIGIGFVGMLVTLLVFKRMNDLKANRGYLNLLAFTYGLACLMAVLWVGYHIFNSHPLFLNGNHLLLWGMAGTFVAIIVLLLAKRTMLAVTLLLLFSLGSTVRINPLYQGLGFVKDNTIVQQIRQISNPDDTWATVGTIQFDTLPLLADRQSLSGVQFYPDLNFWSKVDGPQHEFMYNRQGHLLFVDDPAITEPFHLVQGNYLQVKFMCSDFIKKELDFVVATAPMNHACINLKSTVNYPKLTFYLYEITD